jgi:L-2,4-diaminobutyric acid acetyltransferase
MKHSLDLFELPIPTLRAPLPEDGARIAALAEDFVSRKARNIPETLVGRGAFRETSVLAELAGKLLGWVSAYILPYDPQTLFIWAVEVVKSEQNPGLSSLMLGYLMRQEPRAGLTRVQTVISCDEDRPWALFRQFARWQHSRLDIQPYFTQALTPHKRHENDNLVTICLQDSDRRAA